MNKSKVYISPSKLLPSLLTTLCFIAGMLSAAPLVNFEFNEGTNSTVQDSAQGLTGYFGTTRFDSSVDTVSLVDDSPYGCAGLEPNRVGIIG